MRIAKLHMDPQDKTRFEIQGKSSVKYHLKANHIVEAKRWFWALNNAIQWTKDEAKEEERQKQRREEILRQAKSGGSSDPSKPSANALTPATAVGVPLTASSSRVSFQGSAFGDEEGLVYDSNEPSIAGNDTAQSVRGTTATIAADLDDDEEYGDDASEHEAQPASRDAFNITAHSASLQLNLLSQVSSALQTESRKENAVPISDPIVVQALSTYESAVASLQGLVNDLLKISRDRDAYWQYRLDREADVRRLWEDSMAKVAQEQEQLEGRIEESEEKRKRTKRALKDVLEGQSESATASRRQSRDALQDDTQMSQALGKVQISEQAPRPMRRKSTIRDPSRRKSTIADLTNLSDSDSDEDEEFFDAVDAGEVEVVDSMPPSSPPAPTPKDDREKPSTDLREQKAAEIQGSFKGYEDPVRKKFKMEADNRPKISLWVCPLNLLALLWQLMSIRASSNP